MILEEVAEKLISTVDIPMGKKRNLEFKFYQGGFLYKALIL